MPVLPGILQSMPLDDIAVLGLPLAMGGGDLFVSLSMGGDNLFVPFPMGGDGLFLALALWNTINHNYLHHH
jgi:hypothetical protein